MEATPTDKLKQVQIGDLTTTQLQSTSKLTYIPQDSMLEDAVRIHKAAEAISTFGAGGVLPDSGAILVQVFDDTAGGTSIQPGCIVKDLNQYRARIGQDSPRSESAYCFSRFVDSYSILKH